MKTLLKAALIAGGIALWGAIGRVDYQAAQVTAQIVNSTAANGR